VVASKKSSKIGILDNKLTEFLRESELSAGVEAEKDGKFDGNIEKGDEV
jgi:hypothetical protein